MMSRSIVVACLLAPAAMVSACEDPYSSEQLTKAVDAAIMELQAKQGWFGNLKASTGYPDAMSVSSCTPDENKWTYPKASEAIGLLKRVLDSRKLKVAGVAWGPYKANRANPSGFWPDYMDAIAETIGKHYGLTITLERVYYDNSVLVVQAVEDAEDVDMSEPYYYLGGYHESEPRTEALAFSCITAGTESHFYTNKASSITSVAQLYDQLGGSSLRTVGFIGQGNFDSVSAILPATTQPLFYPNETEIVEQVHRGTLVAGYSSEGNPPEAGTFNVFSTGIVSPRVALFHKDKLWSDCATSSGSMDGVTAALITVSAVTLTLALIMAFIIFKEFSGKPLFMPLLHSHEGGNTNADLSPAGVTVSTSSTVPAADAKAPPA